MTTNRKIYYDLIGDKVVEYRQSANRPDPSASLLLIAETIVSNGVRVRTVFDGEAVLNSSGEPASCHPDGWLETPPKLFRTYLENDNGFEFFECYSTVTQARQGHPYHVQTVRERLA